MTTPDHPIVSSDPGAWSARGFILKRNVDEVVLDVTASTKRPSGTDLEEDDFKIFEDGIPQDHRVLPAPGQPRYRW